MSFASPLVLLSVAVLTPLTLGGYVASSVDTDAFYGPMVQFLNERLHAGDFPLWLPTAFSGQPFFADPQSGLFYPPKEKEDEHVHLHHQEHRAHVKAES